LLRVELARPWFETGDGEQLAVILWDHAGEAPGAALSALVTEAGRDPIWETSEPERWPLEAALAGSSGLTSRHVLLETGDTVLVIPFATFFHGDRWYADVALPAI